MAGMVLDPDRCYRALLARDARFDGRFFVGVSSTRIYCRPVCRVRLPRRDRCRFFPSAAAAEASGFRPCLRCRPELAPGHASVDARRRIAARAASLIEDGLAGEGGLAAVAARCGVSERHLRRVFVEEFGVSPVAFASTSRLLLAKRLLTDTTLPVVDVAMGSGFSSLRRFNALFRARYGLTPSDLRKRAGRSDEADAIVCALGYRPPFDWEGLLSFLGVRAVPGIESVAGGAYRRTVRLEREGRVHAGWLVVEHARRRPAVEVRLSPSLARVVPQVLARVKRLFDLDPQPQIVSEALGPLAGARPGMRVPGAFDGFELAVRAVLGQQVSVGAARTLAGRFAEAFGEPVATPFGELRATFPFPARVARIEPASLRAVGVTPARSRAILALAREVAAGRLGLDPDGDVEGTIARLKALAGIGDWTAQYIAMRALAWPDAFPAGDAGVLKALGETSPARARAKAEAWRPWRAYAVMHLWRSLAPSGTTGGIR